MDRVAHPDRMHSRAQPVNPWRATVSASCATLVGIGLARFAYTPLLPAIINAHWFEASAASYLGAANLAGYLAGAVSGHPIVRRASTAVTIRTMMLAATAAFFACAYPQSFAWFFVWRFVSGFAGGVLMISAAPAVMPHIPASRRGLAGGLIFMGIGVGIAASGTLVPSCFAKAYQILGWGSDCSRSPSRSSLGAVGRRMPRPPCRPAPIARHSGFSPCARSMSNMRSTPSGSSRT